MEREQAMASDDAAAGVKAETRTEDKRTPGEIVAAGLGVIARRHFPGATGVANVTRLTAGATQEIWRFDLQRPDGDEPLILRRTPGGAVVERNAASTSIGLDTEAEILKLV